MLRTLLGWMVLAMTLFAGPRDQGWKKVQAALDKGLPKTAIAELGPLERSALKDRAYGEAIKAIGLRIALEANIQGNKAEEKITRMQEALAQAPPEMKPMMEALLANWYFHYFQQNRWRFLQRTQTAEAPGKDFTTWDLPRILAEIDTWFTQALSHAEVLKATPVSAYDELLQKGSAPDAYRPTMYDFLVYNALAFYTAGEQGAAKVEDAFEIDAEGPIFDAWETFLRWKPSSSEHHAPSLKAIRLYQELLAFHKDDKQRVAFAEADLMRLVYGYNAAVGEGKAARYKAALKRYVETWNHHEISSRALAQWAEVLHKEQSLVEAHVLAVRGMRAFPGSPGGAMCHNLIQEIESKAVRLQTERVWNDPLPTLDVTYRNVTRVHFRAVAVDVEAHLKSQRWGLYTYDDTRYRAMLNRTPSLAWSADLPPTKDFKERTERLPAPRGLGPGFYFVFASPDPTFREYENDVRCTPVWVSDLALVVRQGGKASTLEGLVLNARTGAPLEGAHVVAWEHNPQGGFSRGQAFTTDAQGLFRVASRGDRAVVLVARHGGHQVATAHEVGLHHQGNAQERGFQTVFFTDRALYRPGQTISYKGICIHFDQTQSTYQTLAGQSLTVVFHDANGKEVERRTHTCNDYGAFSGTFTAPQDRVTGLMTLSAMGPEGGTQIRVEEYKRPKFQVELNPPKTAAKLNGEVVLSGKATAYSGTPIGGAKLTWRVEREAHLPPWCWWGPWHGGGHHPASQAIAHGTLTTELDGSFQIRFTAKPDLTLPEKDEPVFHFTVHADVTDTTGETRSRQATVRLAYTAIQAALAIQAWQTPERPVDIQIRTTTHDGEGHKAEGTLTLYRLRQPEKVLRAPLEGRDRGAFSLEPEEGKGHPDPANPETWEPGEVVITQPFKTDGEGRQQVPVALGAGIYRAMLETRDPYGKPVTARATLQVVDPKARVYGIKLPNHFSAPAWEGLPGDTFQALWGTGYDQGRAFVEFECRGKVLQRYWTTGDATQEGISQKISEEMRGGFTLRVTYVRENRAYVNERIVDVPWSNKQLTLTWEHFTSKLAPGQKETWTAVVKAPDAPKAVAEMVAGLYDASLDQYAPHHWMSAFTCFRRETPSVQSQFHNGMLPFQHIFGWWHTPVRPVDWSYRAFVSTLSECLWGYGFTRYDGVPKARLHRDGAPPPPPAPALMQATPGAVAVEAAAAGLPESGPVAKGTLREPQDTAKAEPDLSRVTARKHLHETAFFFPHVMTDTEGGVRMEFTMPEALTEWTFMGFAHDQALRSGFLRGKTVTAKELMVEPNPPRFLREGDTVAFTVKVSNQSDEAQKGRVRLTFADASTGEACDGKVGNTQAVEQAFELPAKTSQSFSWPITIPDGCGFLTYKAVGATATFSDGEENVLPVLSRRILVTESLPLPIRNKQEKRFEFAKLLTSGTSSTLRHEGLVVQMVSQPAWYAVMALPYLMEFPHECSEQTFNRLYANALGRHIANSDPKIRSVFDQWKDTPALESPLEKHQDLKMVMVEETPWLRQAHQEGQARRHVGLLFDTDRMDREADRILKKLKEMQVSDGRWSWFPGGPPSNYITLYIVTGFGRLRHLGVNLDWAQAQRALYALDAWMADHCRRITHKERYVPSATDALYLYGRSFFLKDQAIAGKHKEAVDFLLAQARKFWLDVRERQSQAHLAVALARFSAFGAISDPTPKRIMQSIKERSVTDEELGMFWREQEMSWWWYRAPIETQALMVEAFDEVMHDKQAVEDCQAWLIKQKQTQDWKTTKATADAIYALLLRGSEKLSSQALVEVSMGGKKLEPDKVEAGTGFYEKRFVKAEIAPDLGHITLKKSDEGVSWGSVHWQYLEEMTKVTPYEGTPLKLKKTLFVKTTTSKGQELKPLKGPVAVGDELVVRVELRVDRDMEYVHLKDQRGSGTEPIHVLSRYAYQDGLAYYESTRDTASHFFIDYLPKGTYVFEYPVRVQLRGKYQTGIASIQCMYAPEFNSHSESFTLEVN